MWQSFRSLCLFNALLVIKIISVVSACGWNSQVNVTWSLLISFVFIGNFLCQFQYIMVVGGKITIRMLFVLLFRPSYCCYWQHYLTCVILHCFDVTHSSIKMVFNWFSFSSGFLGSAVIVKTFVFPSLQSSNVSRVHRAACRISAKFCWKSSAEKQSNCHFLYFEVQYFDSIEEIFGSFWLTSVCFCLSSSAVLFEFRSLLDTFNVLAPSSDPGGVLCLAYVWLWVIIKLVSAVLLHQHLILRY